VKQPRNASDATAFFYMGYYIQVGCSLVSMFFVDSQLNLPALFTAVTLAAIGFTKFNGFTSAMLAI